MSADSEPVVCPHCDASHFVADLDFPEPDEGANTQYGWLVATCPECGEDLQVSYDKVSPLLGL